MTILSIKHWRDDEIIWENSHINNILHAQGEEFIVNALFAGGSTSTVIPATYYIGLDNRTTITVADTMTSISGEPIGNGYARVPVASSGDFGIELASNGHWTAISPLLVYLATPSTTGWGPVQNLFLTDNTALTGNLISTASIGTSISVIAGDNVTLQLGMSLLDCTPVNTSS